MNHYTANEEQFKRFVVKVKQKSRQFGKNYQMYCDFISEVKSGLKSLIIGEGYVVMSLEMYKDLNKKNEDT